MSNVHAVQSAIESAALPLETDEQRIYRLSLLSTLEYDRVREKEAEAMGVRVGTLDKDVAKTRQVNPLVPSLSPSIAPCGESVDGEVLLTDIRDTIKRFIVCDPKTAIAATLWIAFTWFIENVQVAPLAIITAPEKRCGKSQFLSLIGLLSRNPLVASNISPSAIFRVIEAQRPTLLIDEADAFLKDNEEARGILNSGHTRQSAYVIRVVGDDHEPKQFSTWGAKAISGIGTLADTLMDRAIVLELRRKMKHEHVERLRYADDRLFERLASMLARYAQDHGNAIGHARPVLPEALNDRAQDNWEPLLAIADYVGGDWPRWAREAALQISGDGEQDSGSLSSELLADIKTVFEEKYVCKVKTADLIDYLCEDDMRPWSTYNRGKPMTPRQLAKRLSGYGIEPKGVRIGTATPKGYERDQFEDTFARYLSTPASPPELSATPPHNGANTIPEPYSSVADIF